jgi:hypothetical protein
MSTIPTHQDPTHNAYANGRPATPKQTAYIRSLSADRALSEIDTIALGRALDRGFNTREASDIIQWLQTKPAKCFVSYLATVAAGPSSPEPMDSPEPIEVTDGMWILGDVIYKVQKAVHGSGRLYAKKLVVSKAFDSDADDTSEVRFEYAPGAVKQLGVGGRKLTLEEAKAFGALYGTCCVCGRTLTNEQSIKDGIGPICAGKF